MNSGYVSFMAITIVMVFGLIVSLVTGKTLGGVLLGDLYSKKGNPTMYWASIGILAVACIVMLIFAIWATADVLGYSVGD
ncbi:MAG TPA: hypothetical protein VFW19_10115 [Allosphingosinicella sp.]|nr:hypothetical protein [Allosphingosinicella sp.]